MSETYDNTGLEKYEERENILTIWGPFAFECAEYCAEFLRILSYMPEDIPAQLTPPLPEPVLTKIYNDFHPNADDQRKWREFFNDQSGTEIAVSGAILAAAYIPILIPNYIIRRCRYLIRNKLDIQQTDGHFLTHEDDSIADHPSFPPVKQPLWQQLEEDCTTKCDTNDERSSLQRQLEIFLYGTMGIPSRVIGRLRHRIYETCEPGIIQEVLETRSIFGWGKPYEMLLRNLEPEPQEIAHHMGEQCANRTWSSIEANRLKLLTNMFQEARLDNVAFAHQSPDDALAYYKNFAEMPKFESSCKKSEQHTITMNVRSNTVNNIDPSEDRIVVSSLVDSEEEWAEGFVSCANTPRNVTILRQCIQKTHGVDILDDEDFE